MGEELSSEQVLDRHTRDLGPDLGAVYNRLDNEVIWIHAKWHLYRQLFAKSEQRIGLLNEVAGFFFGVLQDTLLEDILLGLARLTDPPQSPGKRKNLTLQVLPTLIADGQLAEDVRELVSRASAACALPRDWRNRRLAHRDLNLALAITGDPLPGISRADVENCLAAVRAVMRRIETHYRQPETAYEHFIAPMGDADALVYYLNRGLMAERRKRERLERGVILPEDLESEEKT